MTAIDVAGRYEVEDRSDSEYTVCMDTNLDRRVHVHWVARANQYDNVRERLLTLQGVRSVYVALIYDIVATPKRIGVVEEELRADVTTNRDNCLVRLYQLCAGLGALHGIKLAHGALDSRCFRISATGFPRICNLAFDLAAPLRPSDDYASLFSRMAQMHAPTISDPIFQGLYARLRDVAEVDQLLVPKLRDRLAALLLTDKHRGLIHWRGTSIEIGAQSRQTRLKHPNEQIGVVRIDYDGTRFLIGEVSGEVFINNIPVVLSQELPSSCVIAIGAPSRSASARYFVTFDQSHPEVWYAVD